MGSVRRCGNWLNSYLEYTQHTEAPVHFHFWTAVSTIAGALRRNVYFDQMFFKWFPNFYIIIVAAPGIVNKTTTIDIGMNLLRKVPEINFGPESVTWQALVERMGQSIASVDYPNGDTEQNCAITIPIPEFGTFFTTEDTKLTDLLVSLWDGRTGKFERATKASGSESVTNPWINMIAGTTPSWLTSNFPAYMIGGGFTSRCVFVYGEKKRQYLAYPRDFKTEAFLEIEAALIEDLCEIAALRGEFQLSSEARDFGENWYKSIFQNITEVDMQLQGHLARKQTHVHKLAMVLAAAEGNDLIITKEVLQKAIALVESVEKDLLKVFDNVGATTEGSLNANILEAIIGHGQISKQVIYRKFMGRSSHRHIEDAILTLTRSGQITQVQVGNIVYLRPIAS